MFKCPGCNNLFKKFASLCTHAIRASHVECTDRRRLYVDIVLGGVEPLCACGCGKVPEFVNANIGFNSVLCGHSSAVRKAAREKAYLVEHFDGQRPVRHCKCGCGTQIEWRGPNARFPEYVNGHNSRVDNPYNAPDVRERSRQGVIKAHAEGRIHPYGYDGSDESKARRIAVGKKAAITIRNSPDEIKRRAEAMRRNRLNGIIPTQRRENHYAWNVNTPRGLGSLVSSGTLLYRLWKRPLLVKAEFKCVQCGADDHLHVHHSDETLASICKHFAEQCGVTRNSSLEELEKCAEKIVEYHHTKPVAGMVLCYNCHKLHHKSFNFSPGSRHHKRRAASLSTAVTDQ